MEPVLADTLCTCSKLESIVLDDRCSEKGFFTPHGLLTVRIWVMNIPTLRCSSCGNHRLEAKTRVHVENIVYTLQESLFTTLMQTCGTMNHSDIELVTNFIPY